MILIVIGVFFKIIIKIKNSTNLLIIIGELIFNNSYLITSIFFKRITKIIR